MGQSSIDPCVCRQSIRYKMKVGFHEKSPIDIGAIYNVSPKLRQLDFSSGKSRSFVLRCISFATFQIAPSYGGVKLVCINRYRHSFGCSASHNWIYLSSDWKILKKHFKNIENRLLTPQFALTACTEIWNNETKPLETPLKQQKQTRRAKLSKRNHRHHLTFIERS